MLVRLLSDRRLERLLKLLGTLLRLSHTSDLNLRFKSSKVKLVSFENSTSLKLSKGILKLRSLVKLVTSLTSWSSKKASSVLGLRKHNAVRFVQALRILGTNFLRNCKKVR
jgi:hypothetical protein